MKLKLFKVLKNQNGAWAEEYIAEKSKKAVEKLIKKSEWGKSYNTKTIEDISDEIKYETEWEVVVDMVHNSDLDYKEKVFFEALLYEAFNEVFNEKDFYPKGE